jgi:hypothetical protein
MLIDEASDKLTALLTHLTVRWDELRTIWDDAVRRDYERTYIETLQVQVQGIRRAMDDLGAAVEYARRVAEDR